jgi:hypothetical protein
MSSSACRPVCSTLSSGSRTCSGFAVQRLPGRTGVQDHHAHPVRDDVVQLPGDAPALMCDRRPHHLVVVTFRGTRLVLGPHRLECPCTDRLHKTANRGLRRTSGTAIFLLNHAIAAVGASLGCGR